MKWKLGVSEVSVLSERPGRFFVKLPEKKEDVVASAGPVREHILMNTYKLCRNVYPDLPMLHPMK